MSKNWTIVPEELNWRLQLGLYGMTTEHFSHTVTFLFGITPADSNNNIFTFPFDICDGWSNLIDFGDMSMPFDML